MPPLLALQAQMSKFCKKYIGFIDSLTERLRSLIWLIPVMMFIMLFEVVARYLFHSPTKWAWDVNTQILCFFAVSIGGYTLLHGSHIRSDILYAKWSIKKKAWVDLITSFLPLIYLGGVLTASIKLAARSVTLSERTTSLLESPIYPLKIVIAIGSFLFLLQVISEIMRNFLIVAGKLDSGETDEP
jgi:TRAP-type mannitol/chloroaromatic compound transport system permease small subunit